MAAKPVPDGFRTVTPHLAMKNSREAIAFYKKAFGAEEVMVMPGPDGQSVMHAEIKIGDSIVMLHDEWPAPDAPQAPSSLKGTTVSVHLYVNDCDKVFNQAVQAGATVVNPPMDMFWGDRFGKVSDPFGHQWSIATHTKDVTPEECQQASEAFFKSMGEHCK